MLVYVAGYREEFAIAFLKWCVYIQIWQLAFSVPPPPPKKKKQWDQPATVGLRCNLTWHYTSHGTACCGSTMRVHVGKALSSPYAFEAWRSQLQKWTPVSHCYSPVKTHTTGTHSNTCGKVKVVTCFTLGFCHQQCSKYLRNFTASSLQVYYQRSYKACMIFVLHMHQLHFMTMQVHVLCI